MWIRDYFHQLNGGRKCVYQKGVSAGILQDWCPYSLLGLSIMEYFLKCIPKMFS